MKKILGPVFAALAVSCAAEVKEVSGVIGDRAFEKGAWRLVGDAVYTTTNCTPRFLQDSVLDVAGHALELRVREKSWDNIWLEGSMITNGAASAGRISLRTPTEKLHIRTPNWRGGAQNVLEASNGRLYIRTAVDVPDCWTLRLAAEGPETVMGDAVTGTQAGKYLWSGPVEIAGGVLFADDTKEPAGGWGCTLTGPMSGPATATVTLARAFCLRVGSKSNTFAGNWILMGGGNGTHRCRLEFLKDSACSGRMMKVADSDIVLDAGTVFTLPRVKHVAGNCRIVGGAKGTALPSLLKQGAGALTLASAVRVGETLRVEEGVLSIEKDAAGNLPSFHRLVMLPGTTLDLNGNDLVVDEFVGEPKILNAGKIHAASRCALPVPKPGTDGPSLLADLKRLMETNSFHWAWTEAGRGWGSLDGGWPRYRTRVGELTGRAPCMMYYDLATVVGTRSTDDSYADHRRVCAEAIRTHWRACRGIPVFSWHMEHPCATNGFGQAFYRYKCKEHPHVIKDILEGTKYPCGVYHDWSAGRRSPCESPRAWYFARLDEIAAFFNRLRDDEGNRIPVIMRYAHEMDGAWFWWGKGWATSAEFVALSRMTADYLREKCGRDYLLFAYTPDRTWKEMGAEGDGGHNFLSWYPGDDYVDVLGFDDYSIGKGNTPEKAEENFNETLRKLREVSAFARAHGKVCGITETGCKDANGDFWTRLLRLATAEGVACAFVNTWGGPWTLPDSEAGVQDQRRFIESGSVLTISDADLQKAADAGF